MMTKNCTIEKTTKPSRRSEAGVALFASLALLLIFAMLGTAYVRYMTTNLHDTRYSLQQVRADYLSQGGIYAAIGELEAARAQGEEPDALYNFELQAYRNDETGVRVADTQEVNVKVRDESGLVNLNHAPESLLIALGIPAEVVAKLRVETELRPLTSVDDLRTRDFMNTQVFTALNTDVFTVHTGDQGSASINLNTADVSVLAAIFNVDPAEAHQIAEQRPFRSWQDVVSKVAREPSTFSIATKRDRSMPDGISLDTSCYRLLSEAYLQTRNTTSKGLQVAVEAVVQLHAERGYSIRHWNENPPDASFEMLEQDDRPEEDTSNTTENAGNSVTTVAHAIAQSN
ncbi:MAG: type II secretion system protein GspK [Candidatus Hydrogenedentota bacterium]